MMSKPSQSPSDLRRQAEGLLKKQPRSLPEEDAARLLHELQVHQIELELQNEELSKAHTEVSALRDKYLELYDFAPIGYFTLTQSGDIVELNLSAAALLGETRDTLVGRRLTDFVQPQSAAAFAEFLAAAVAETADASTTLTLRHPSGNSIYVKAQGRTFQSDTVHGKEIRIAIMDLTELAAANEELRRSFEKFFRYWRP